MFQWLLLLLIFQINQSSFGNLQNFKDTLLKNCESARDQILPYVDWPVRINCSSLIGQGVPINLTQCANNSRATIVSTRKQLTRETLTFTIQQPSDSHGTCASRNISVDAFPINSRPWIDDVNTDVGSRNDIINITLSFLDSTTLQCHHPGIDISADAVSFPPATPYTAIWRRSTIDPSTNSSILIPSLLNLSQRPQKEQIAAGHYPSPFELERINFYEPGIYSCEMRSRGRRTYAVHYSVCLIDRRNEVEGTPIVECQAKKEFTLSQNLTISCTVLVRSGAVESNELELDWTKVEEGDGKKSVCAKANVDDKPNGSAQFGRISCGWKSLKNAPLRCINYQVLDGMELSPDLLQFEIFMHLSNSERADEGTYSVRLRLRDYWSNDLEVKLIYNNLMELRSRNIILFSVLAVLLFLLIVTALTWYNKTKILLFKRKHFGSFDKDDKEFVASLYYYFNQQMNNEELENTRTVVSWTRETLAKLNYNYLDSQENFQPGYLPETILSNISRSRTLIVVLTQSFTNDSNSMFIANQGYLSMLKNETKLILISTPGAITSVKRNDSRFSKEILKAIKGSNVIKWKKSTRESRFKEALQYELPHIHRSKSCAFEKLKNDISVTINNN